jgi:hypothetical protein
VQAGALAKVQRAVGEKGELDKVTSDSYAAGYDKHYRLMAFDARGKASDRQLTDDELLQRSQDHYRQLERQQKLQAAVDEGGDAAKVDDDTPMGGYKGRRLRARQAEVRELL